MTKKTSLLITSIIVGSLSLAAFTPAAFAFGSDRHGQGANKQGQQMQQMFNEMHKKSHSQAQNRFGARGGKGRGAGFIGVICNEKAPEMLETRYDRIGKALDLSAEQKLLFESLKTASLVAQTEFLDVCEVPKRDKNLGIIEKIKAKNTNMEAVLKASNSVLPEFEAFINSLSDEQKSKFGKGKRGGPNRGQKNSD